MATSPWVERAKLSQLPAKDLTGLVITVSDDNSADWSWDESLLDDTLSSDKYTVQPEAGHEHSYDLAGFCSHCLKAVPTVDLTVVCYDHYVSYPEGASCPDCDAVVAAALRAV